MGIYGESRIPRKKNPNDAAPVSGQSFSDILWMIFCRWDELHPSEQADRIVAREITALMKGEHSRWTTWLS